MTGALRWAIMAGPLALMVPPPPMAGMAEYAALCGNLPPALAAQIARDWALATGQPPPSDPADHHDCPAACHAAAERRKNRPSG